MNNDFTDDEKSGFYKAIFSRRDVRSKFTSQEIDDGVLTRILNAAHHAPSLFITTQFPTLLFFFSFVKR